MLVSTFQITWPTSTCIKNYSKSPTVEVIFAGSVLTTTRCSFHGPMAKERPSPSWALVSSAITSLLVGIRRQHSTRYASRNLAHWIGGASIAGWLCPSSLIPKSWIFSKSFPKFSQAVMNLQDIKIILPKSTWIEQSSLVNGKLCDGFSPPTPWSHLYQQSSIASCSPLSRCLQDAHGLR